MITLTTIADRTLNGCTLLLGILAIGWTASIFATTNALAFTITVVIGGVYTIGTIELIKFGQATASLSRALDASEEKIEDFDDWSNRLDPSLRQAVRLRVEGQRVGLPAPVLTPYLVGLLVMLGILGTFVGLVDTLRGAVVALERTTDLQAIRQSLAAPINGLGMAFGTSVAGVATSAMLGLMSTLNRRRRMLETRRLDARISTCFREHSMVHRQRETFRALQQQTQALPAVAGMLETVAGKLAHMAEGLETSQKVFHGAVADQFARLCAFMDQALKENLAANAQRVGETITPIVDGVMQTITRQSQAAYGQLSEVSRQTVAEFNQQLGRQSDDYAALWKDMRSLHEKESEALLSRLDSLLKVHLVQCDQSVGSMQERFSTSASAWLERLEETDQERLENWREAFETLSRQATAHLSDLSGAMASELAQVADAHRTAFDTAARDFKQVSSTLTAAWQSAGDASVKRQGELAEMSTQAVAAFKAHLQEMGAGLQAQMHRLMESSNDLMNARRETEAAWIADHAERMAIVNTTVAEQLGALRDDEDQRGRAAVARLEALETVLAAHLTTLGQGLEAPLTRLIETAHEAPRAAATLVDQMHRQTARQVDRDNRLLDERRQIMEQLQSLCISLGENINGQREAIEQLAASAKAMMENTADRFSEKIDSDLSSLSTAADTVAVSAVDMASLGASFGKAVDVFGAANNELIENLAHIEDALEKASTRSDDQMGYVVAQAREIIEYTMLSQREVVEELRQLSPSRDIDIEAN